MFLLKAHAGVSSRAWGLHFGQNHHLHTYFVYASGEGSGEFAHMRRHAWAFTVRQCEMYQNLMFCLISLIPQEFLTTIQRLIKRRNGGYKIFIPFHYVINLNYYFNSKS